MLLKTLMEQGRTHQSCIFWQEKHRIFTQVAPRSSQTHIVSVHCSAGSHWVGKAITLMKSLLPALWIPHFFFNRSKRRKLVWWCPRFSSHHPFFSIQISLFSCIVLLSSENKPVNVWKNLSGFLSAQPSILNRACSWLFQKEPSHQAAEICPTLTFLGSRKTYTIRRKSSLESQLAHLQLRSILTYRTSLVRSATALSCFL